MIGAVVLGAVAIDQLQRAARPAPSLGTITSWIDGTVSAGPTCPSPASSPAPACASRPLGGAVIEERVAGVGVINRTTSADDGTFEFVQSGGGTFTLVAEPVPGTLTTPLAVTVAVAANSGVRVELRYTSRPLGERGPQPTTPGSAVGAATKGRAYPR